MKTPSAIPHFTRREMLKLLTPAVALGLAAPRVRGAEVVSEKGFTFISVNDLHYADDTCGDWFRLVVAAMKASAPDAAFCLMNGDLADKGGAEALGAVRAIFGELAIPLHAVPGNHDYLTPTDHSGYDAHFAGMLNHHFTHAGWQFIGLDSTDGLKFADTAIADGTLAWLDAELPKLDPAAPTVAFTHFPLGEGVAMRPLNAEVLLERLFKLNLRAVFSGHWHGASERMDGNALITTQRCCARIRGNADQSPLKGWFVCEAKADGTVLRRFVEAPPITA